MRLYEVDQAIMDLVDEETGEILDIDKFEELSMARDAKVEGILLWIKNLRAETEALKKEEKTLKERREVAENKLENLKNYIASYLNGEKFATSKVKVSYRKSDKVQIDEGAKVPEEFLKYKEPEVNKTDLKKAIKAGQKFEGIRIVESQNIQIR